MQVIFKKAINLDGVHFSKGTFEVSDEKCDHWFLQGLIKSGDVVILEGPKKVAETDTDPLLLDADQSVAPTDPAVVEPQSDQSVVSEESKGAESSIIADVPMEETKPEEKVTEEAEKPALSQSNKGHKNHPNAQSRKNRG